MTRSLLLILLLGLAVPAGAGIYKWVDAQGRVHFSNQAPPPGVKAVVYDPNVWETAEKRARREQQTMEAMKAAEREANALKPYKGLTFERYIAIRRGMSEGDLLGIAGEPDLEGNEPTGPVTAQVGYRIRAMGRAGLPIKTWTYMATASDPSVTTITLVGGRVSEIDRVRQ